MKRFLLKNTTWFLNPPQWIWDLGLHKIAMKILFFIFRKEVEVMKGKDYLDYTIQEDKILHITCLGQV